MHKKAFSLIELSIVILVIGILVIGITQGSRILSSSKLKSAQTLTAGSPVNSMTGLVLWLDATDNATISTGTVASNTYTNAPDDNADVVDWMDRNPQISIAQKELTALADANRPKYIKNGINGLPTLRFDGVNDYLENANTVIGSGKNNFTMMAVWKSTNRNGSNLFTQSKSSCSGGTAGFMNNGGFVGHWGCGADYTSNLPFAANTTYLQINVSNGGNPNTVKIYLNRSTASSGSIGLGLSGSLKIDVGANPDGTSNFSGDLSEIIVFDRALTNAEIASIQDYLFAKYGI